MRKLLFILLLLTLVACGTAGNSEPTQVDATRPSVATTTSPTDAPPTEVPPTAVSETNESTTEPEAVAVITDGAPPITSATTVAEAATIRPEDWATGATNPVVTIIEYGDFQ